MLVYVPYLDFPVCFKVIPNIRAAYKKLRNFEKIQILPHKVWIFGV